MRNNIPDLYKGEKSATESVQYTEHQKATENTLQWYKYANLGDSMAYA